MYLKTISLAICLYLSVLATATPTDPKAKDVTSYKTRSNRLHARSPLIFGKPDPSGKPDIASILLGGLLGGLPETGSNRYLPPGGSYPPPSNAYTPPGNSY